MKMNDHGSVHVWLVMTKAIQAVGRRLSRQLQDMDLADTDFRVLEALLHKGPLPVNVIGPKVNLNPGSISVAVDRLYDRGLVARVEDPADRRIRTVSLTSEGQNIITVAYKRHTALIDKMFSELTLCEQAQLEDLLKRLGKSAEPRPCSGQVDTSKKTRQ